MGNTADTGGGIYNDAATLKLDTSTVTCENPDDIYGDYLASHSTIGGCIA